MDWCLQAVHSYRGPLIAIALGIGFVLVGAVPVAVTFSINAKGSATIIGVGFIGFGLLLILPGIGWCLVRRASRLHCCRSHAERLRPDDEYAAEDETSGPRGALDRTTSMTSSSQPKATYISTNDHVIKSAVYFGTEDDDGPMTMINSSSSNKDSASDEQELTEELDISQDNGDVRLTR
jgi:hypothetical protein